MIKRLLHLTLFCYFPLWLFAAESDINTSNVIWLEAECFENTGGWVNDPQFIDIMGSPYLLANGVDAPVEDAVTHVDIPQDGTYRLWVRAKDWLPDYSPGQFEIIINNQPLSKTFGQASHDEWRWFDGGEIDLEKGESEIRLRDMTGWWGRCDALVLSYEDRFKPSDDLYVLENHRREHFEPYRNIDETVTYDVVVVGGGLAGSAAAISAARHGSKVALIQDRPVLGGNASSEIDVAPGGDNSRAPFDPGETGIIEEFYGKNDRGFDHDWSSAIEKVVRGEENLDLFLNTRAINVIMKDRHSIESVVAVNVHSGKRLLFPGKIFIDCTGDGWIGFYAGADFRKGREAQSEFNESLAPAEADSKTMGNTLMVAKFREGPPSTFDNPEWAYEWTSMEQFQQDGFHFGLDSTEIPDYQWQDPTLNRFTHGAGFYGRQYITERPKEEKAEAEYRSMPIPKAHFKEFEKGKGYRPRSAMGGFFEWWVEFGGIMDTIKDAEHIRDELFRINLGLWNYVKNHSPQHKENNKYRRLTWINYIAGKRESRRLIGDYILTQWDYADKIIHSDNVAYGGWGIDVHHPNGFWTDGPMYYSAYRGQKVSIPYRCLYSRSVDNLYMAGRNVSVSHVALGGVRVMRTTCLMGQAVGTSAALCVEKELLPYTAGERHIHEIQQRLMKDGVYVMGQKNEDPEDLALQASVTASSVKSIPDPNQSASLSTPLIHDLNMQRAVMFKVPSSQLDKIALYLINKNNTPTPVTLTLRKAKAFRDFSSTKNLAQAKTDLPAKSEGWETFELNAKVTAGEYYYVFLQPVEGAQWRLFSSLKDETCRAYGGPNWTLRDECYTFDLTPETPVNAEIPKVALSPENVIDGFNRAVHADPHSWGPDPSKDEPHWIEFEFESAKTFNTIHVTFQNLNLFCKSYHIDAFVDNDWKTILSVNENTNRRNVHSFGSVSAKRVRLVLTSPAVSNPNESAQVCEVRIYNEQ